MPYPGIADDLVSAQDLKFVRRSTDATPRSNTTTLTNDSQLQWPVLANEVWFVRAFLLVDATNTTMDFKVGWSIPSGSMKWGALANVEGDVGIPGFGLRGTGVGGQLLIDQTGSISTGTVSGTVGKSFAGWVEVGSASGIVALQWAQNTLDAGNLRLMKNSFLELRRLVG